MADRTAVTIVKSTDKAHLIEDDDGRQGWIQKRWLRDDNTVGTKTFDRSIESKTTREAESKRLRELASEFRNDFHPIKIVRETEKAVAATASWMDGYCVNEGEQLAWFPKSQVQDGAVPGWLILAKAREIGERLIGNKNHYSIVVTDIGGIELCVHTVPDGWIS